jgi:hypothetical protein
MRSGPKLNQSSTPAYTSIDALSGYEYDPERVSTSGSVLVTKVALSSAWMCTFIALTLYFGAFTILQRKGSANLTTTKGKDPLTTMISGVIVLSRAIKGLLYKRVGSRIASANMRWRNNRTRNFLSYGH